MHTPYVYVECYLSTYGLILALTVLPVCVVSIAYCCTKYFYVYLYTYKLKDLYIYESVGYKRKCLQKRVFVYMHACIYLRVVAGYLYI